MEQGEVSATATSTQPDFPAERALDGDPDTFWASAFDPHEELPASITLDLGRRRDLTGVTYVGHLVGRYYEEPGNVAGIDRYRVSVSTDGKRFRPAGSGELEQDRRPQWVPLADGKGRAVRYVRLTATEGFTDYAGVAELNAYERRDS